MDEDRKQYELVLIVPPNLEGGDLQNVKKEIENIVQKSQGSIDFKEEKKHELAYPINKQRQGIYIISQISISPEKVNNLSKELKLNKQVIRHLISQLPTVKPEKKAAIKPKIKQMSQPAPIQRNDLKSKDFIEKPKTAIKPPAKISKPEDKTKLEEIDKKLDEIIKEI